MSWGWVIRRERGDVVVIEHAGGGYWCCRCRIRDGCSHAAAVREFVNGEGRGR